ncbi:MAG: Ig-like domain-containing protein [Planctomycetes bacterium]|nr:Ig-like domain-containing protein [Planctomycetota bacterium]
MNALSKLRSPASSLAGLTLLAAAVALGGCAGGTKGDPDNRGDFKVVSISTGTGAIYPYRIRTVDTFGNPTTNVVNIESDETLKANVNGNNGVLPVATFSTAALLPDGNPGNHFLHFTFSHKLDVDSILSNQLANQGNSGLGGALNVLAYDPATETSTTLQGRGFVNGFTYYNVGGQLQKVQAVGVDPNNSANVEILDARASGFPQYAGAADLVGKKVFTFVADSDNDLTTIETFPANRLLRIVVTNAVRDSENDILEAEVGTATTVGIDTNRPQVLGYLGSPSINPGNGQTGIDPTATILVRFNKPVQPGEVGSFFDPQQFTPPSGGLTLQVTASAQTFAVLYHADPVSYGDLMNYIIRPAYNLPGNSPVDVTVQTTTINSLTGLLIGQAVTTRFTTGTGPGIVNAPVAPEAVYVGIGGATPGVSVIDLNGFGQGTGDINNTRFPLNPNIGVNGVTPPLAPGASNLDAGSGGVFTLVKDTNGETRLLRDPVVGDVTDIHIGAPLDIVFNNVNINVNASGANQINELMGAQQPGNVISQPPVPNPPRLLFPPPNPNRAIFGEEPTTKSSYGPVGNLVTGGPPAGCITSPLNLLTQGNPFSSQVGQVGLLGTLFNGVFVGPQPPPGSPPPPPPYCPFTARQQVGHFLYVLDRDNRQVVVVNSNRFTVLDTIPLSDPVSMAMSPNMTRLAVTNFASSSVAFIDIDPTSSNFNTLVTSTPVERGPTAVAWQPDGEDVLVASTDANILSIISAFDFQVRRTVSGFMNNPIEIIATERYQATGNASGVYYAYILNENGSIAIYESGPDGVNGIGFNDVIGTVTNVSFPRAQAMIFDHQAQQGGVFISHVDESGLGQVSRLWLTSSPAGQLPLNPNIGGFIIPPTYRQKEWTVSQRFGGANATVAIGQYLSGNSVIDLCTDNLLNFGGFLGQSTQFNLAYLRTPYYHSGKHTVKVNNGGGFTFAAVPRYLFVALSDVGKIDVIEIETGTTVTTIDVPGVRVVADYWRQ